MTSSPFKNKIALVTGHTGFKGSWLSAWFSVLGARVVGVALEPPSQPAHFEVAGLDKIVEGHHIDIRDSESLNSFITQIRPDFVFHLAAQALVRRSYSRL